MTRRRSTADFNDEIQAHVELEAERLVEEEGLSPDEALRKARQAFGSLVRARKRFAHESRWTWLAGLLSSGDDEPPGITGAEPRWRRWADDFAQDLSVGLRALWRDRAVGGFAVLIVGMGVGAATTVFGVANTLLIRPLPFEAPDRLVFISNGEWNGDQRSAVSVQLSHVQDLRDADGLFDDVAGYHLFDRPGAHVLTGAGDPARLTRLRVTDTFFSLLGVQPLHGRFFTPEEIAVDGQGTVVLSHRLWATRFSSDPALVGSSIGIDGQQATVVGVLPESFDFSMIFEPGNSADYVQPFSNSPRNERSGNTLAVVGRLAGGVSVEAAQAAAELIVSRRARDDRNTFAPRVMPLRERISGEFRSPTLLLGGAVVLVMLLVCANVSNLLLSRGIARRRELSIRAALGGNRGRLVRQLLTESLAMAMAGGALGVGLAIVGTQLIANLDVGVPLLASVRIDLTVLMFALASAVGAGLLFGVMPALRLSLATPQSVLRRTARGASGSRDQRRLQAALVVAEVGLACGLLVGSGLLIRSFAEVLSVERGFQPDNAVAMRIDPPTRFDSEEARIAYLDRALTNALDEPQIQRAGITDILPLVSFNRRWDIEYDGDLNPFVRVVTEGYFAALGMELSAGRDFGREDDRDAPYRIAINEITARILFPDGDAVGRTLRMNGADWVVVGVVRPTRHVDLEQDPGPEVFIPMRQVADHASLYLIARGQGTTPALMTALRRAMSATSPDLPRNEVVSLAGIVTRVTSPRRFVLWLMTAFAGFALLMSCLGIYGVVSYSVRERKPEMGIRLALGASPASLRRSVLKHTLWLAIVGLGIGFLIAWSLSRAMGSMLFGVTGFDGFTFAGVAALLLLAAAVAGYAPAASASRADPTEALRAGD